MEAEEEEEEETRENRKGGDNQRESAVELAVGKRKERDKEEE